MIAVPLDAHDDFEGWRVEARKHAAARTAPEALSWLLPGQTRDLFSETATPPCVQALPALAPVRANRAFLDLARHAALHADPGRFDLLYRLLLRLQDHPRLIEDAADGQVALAMGLARQVRREIHKMRAFVRFREVPGEDSENSGRFVAWFEPEHHIERANAGFFMNRFASQRFSILTPRLSLHWDGSAMHEGPGASRADAPDHDATEDLWRGYYRSIFNPARLKVATMLREMPRRYWKNMPESQDIGPLIAGAQAREAAMVDAGTTPFATARPPTSLAQIRAGIAGCRACAIGCNGTRGVSGEGPAQAALMIVGEQAGDTEERAGRPFVGPAGQLLDRALIDTGVERSAAYVTNAVRHFKFTAHGKRRLHQTPTAGEIDICRWWLDAERAVVRPRVILALGASAGRALTGRTPSPSRERGFVRRLEDGADLWQTVHPSYLLRLDGKAREREEARFMADLAALARRLDDEQVVA